MRRKIPTLIMAVVVGCIFGAMHYESAMSTVPWWERNRPEPVIYEVEIEPIVGTELIVETETDYIDEDIPIEVQEAAKKWGEIYDICPEFLEAMAFKESTYNPAVSNGECLGLMQVNPRWHWDRMERLGVSEADLFTVDGCMAVAADYLNELFATYEDPAVVLAVYNGDSRALDPGYISDYAELILKLSRELEIKHGKLTCNAKSHQVRGVLNDF